MAIMELYLLMVKQEAEKLIRCLEILENNSIQELYLDRCKYYGGDNLKYLIRNSIFSFINSSENEFVLTCSMLEIYKETLYDLLSIHKADLKIKENP